MKILKLFKRWIDMLAGRSVFHVEQGIGKYYDRNEVKGYYNDLTGKVNEKTKLDKKGIPITTTITGVKAYFPIAIFQYALGLYDLYLENNEKDFLRKFLNIADWAVENIDEKGMWDCMGTLKDSKHYTQSSMCQSEGISVLIRAHKESKKTKYLITAQKAIDFMITDVEKGGTCSYKDNNVMFQEYVYEGKDISVLNGWIFSIFGLYDYNIYFNDEKISKLLDKSLKSLSNQLYKYDRKFWTNYDQVRTIASPAYHDLHIKQLKLLYELTDNSEYKNYAIKWEKYSNNKLFKIMAMLIKFIQKMKKNTYYDINTSTVS